MFDRIKAASSELAGRIADRRFCVRYRVARLCRAWAYFRGNLNAEDAQRIMLNCEYAAGWYPLLVLTVEDTLQQAREVFANHPDLPRLINDGCARVGDKWESHNDELYEARRWAIDLAAEYAAAEAIPLMRLDGGDEAAHSHEEHDRTPVCEGDAS